MRLFSGAALGATVVGLVRPVLTNTSRAVAAFVAVALPSWLLLADEPAKTKKPDTASKPAATAKTDDGAKPDKGSKFLRVRRAEDKSPQALETAVTRFVSANGKNAGVVVDLVSVIHIADREYYEELNTLFRDYDAVLYELVAPEGQRPQQKASSGGGTHPLTAFQKGLQSMLALEFQLEQVDYTCPNFIHADMTPTEMSKSMQDRNESWMQMIFRMLGQSFAQQSKSGQRNSDAEMIFALFAKDRPLRLKRIAAEQFDDLEGSLAAFQGADGSTLITERNKKALQVMDRELKNGKKRLAIFYGAGHMPDIEQRLIQEFGFRREGEKWLTAWKLAPKP